MNVLRKNQSPSQYQCVRHNRMPKFSYCKWINLWSSEKVIVNVKELGYGIEYLDITFQLLIFFSNLSVLRDLF